MDITIRPIKDSEFDVFRACSARGFGGDLHKDDDPNILRSILDPMRTVCAFDGNEMVGVSAAFTFDLAVPSGTLGMGGTTYVSVLPTHRRRGVLNSMMQAHLNEIKNRGEPLAGLWASESSIYGRYGYGYAVEGSYLKINSKEIHFTESAPSGSVNFVETDIAKKVLPKLYEQTRPAKPGMLSRSEAWWNARWFADPEHHRNGKSARRFIVYKENGQNKGYAAFRQKADWQWEGFPNSTVHVEEVIAQTNDAHHAIWRFLTSIDLHPNVHYWNAPVDDPLIWRVTKPRRIQRFNTDSLWIRLIDIQAALEGRHYSSMGRIVFDIHDEFMPENSGKYELEVSSTGAKCKKTSDDANITLSVTSLGALYLGGHRFKTLAQTGLVQGDPKELVAADKMFSWSCAPWCPEVF